MSEKKTKGKKWKKKLSMFSITKIMNKFLSKSSLAVNIKITYHAKILKYIKIEQFIDQVIIQIIIIKNR